MTAILAAFATGLVAGAVLGFLAHAVMVIRRGEG